MQGSYRVDDRADRVAIDNSVHHVLSQSHQGCGLPDTIKHLTAAAMASPSADSASIYAPKCSPVECQGTGDLTFSQVSECVRVSMGGITVPS